MSKFLILGDTHGTIPKIKKKKFDAIICTGDVCSSELRTYMMNIVATIEKGETEIHAWYNVIGRRKARKMVNQSVRSGRRVLEYLNSFGVPVFLVPGNWDWSGNKKSEWAFLKRNLYEEKLLKGFLNIKSVDLKLNTFLGVDIIGYGKTYKPEISKDSKKKVKSKKEYGVLVKKYSKLFEKAKNPVIFLSHNVPYGTKLDVINDVKNSRHGEHFGSLLVSDMIKKFKPIISVGGHIHEGEGTQKIGKTLAINAGCEHSHIFVEVEKGKVKVLKN